MDLKSLGSAILTFAIGLIGGSAFLFITSGFVPDNCIITTEDNGCLGLASIFPRGLQGILFLALVIWCVYLAIKEYHKEVAENVLKKKNADYIAKIRSKK